MCGYEQNESKGKQEQNMKNKLIKQSIWLNLLSSGSFLLPVIVMAAPGVVSDVPIFTVNSAESNIFFMLDESGSMDFELMTNERDTTGVGWDGTLFASSSNRSIYTTPHHDMDHVYSGNNVVPNDSDFPDNGLWRARNSHYNFIYYNPAVTYEPWVGVDSAGNAYTKYTSADSVRRFPYNSSSDTTDLTDDVTDVETQNPANGTDITTTIYIPHYHVWDSVSDANGVVDSGDANVRIDIKSGVTVCSAGTAATEAEQISSSCMLRSYDDEIANFANWWAYHRRREYVAKNAVSDVISGSNGIRMGMGNIHNDTSYQVEIASMNNDVTTGNKRALLNALYNMESDGGGTPLRTALEDAGEYYNCDNTSNNIFGNTNCPIISTVTSPATEAPGVCQHNFTILVSDGFYNGGSPGFANDDGDDSDFSGTNNLDGASYTFKFDGNPYSDSSSDTLADVAMHYYERDLSGLSNKVPSKCGVDENPAQHMVTYAIAMGLSGDIDTATLPDHPQRGFEVDSNNNVKCPAPTVAPSAFTWPDPTAAGSNKIDDMLHAAFNGRGLYASAKNPDDLITALDDAIKNTSDRTGSAAAVAFNSTTLSNNTAAVYLALFNSGSWNGDLESFALDGNTGVISTQNWSAAAVLDARDLTANDRVVVTSNKVSGVHNSTGTGIPFRWDTGVLSALQLSDLRTKPDGSVDSDANAEKRLEYLRGDRSNEANGLNFRIRESRLGDIVHSAPVFVGAPQQVWPNGDYDEDLSTSNGWPEGNEQHSIFRSNLQVPIVTDPVTPPGMKDRSGLVFVGANDGMLHAFDETTGSELLAYIPSNLFSSSTAEGLHFLSDPAYAHRYYVDLTPTISDVYIKSRFSTSTKAWHTVLIGANRAGGNGIFALDVTKPTNITEANADKVVLWEFTHPKLGKTFSRPVIIPTNIKDSDGLYRWAAIMGNGYNNTDDGKSSLFIVFIDGGLDGTWTDGSSGSDLDYVIITTSMGTVDSSDCAAAQSDCNGMSSPAVVDLDGNSVADLVYAGDVHGNLWAFDLSDASSSNWRISHDDTNDKPLFYARDDSSNRQPITITPQVAIHPTETTEDSNRPNVLVMFGTGQYIASGDASTTSVQSVYGVWDNENDGVDGEGEKTRAELLEQTIDFQGTISNLDIRVVSDNSISWTGGSAKEGWYLDLVYDDGDSNTIDELGERVVTTPVLRGKTLFFNTTIASPNPCSAGGSGWLMSLDYSNGGRPDNSIFDIDGDYSVNESDLVTYGNVRDVVAGGQRFRQGMPASPAFLGNKQYTPGTTTTSGDEIEVRTVEELGGAKTGRLSWQQL